MSNTIRRAVVGAAAVTVGALTFAAPAAASAAPTSAADNHAAILGAAISAAEATGKKQTFRYGSDSVVVSYNARRPGRYDWWLRHCDGSRDGHASLLRYWSYREKAPQPTGCHTTKVSEAPKRLRLCDSTPATANAELWQVKVKRCGRMHRVSIA